MPSLATSTPAVLVRLGAWREDDDRELPRRSYGYRQAMSDRELEDSARAWWHLSQSNAAKYDYLAAVHENLVVGIWEIDHASWRRASEATCERLGTSRTRWGVDLVPASAEITVLFEGRDIPLHRSDGRRVFGRGSVVAYWPA